MYNLIIFDCDGVLVDSEPIVNRVYVEMMRSRGFDLNERDSLHQFAGTHMPARLKAYGEAFAWEPEATFAASFHARLDAELQERLKPVSGVEEVFKGCKVPVAVASNGTQKEIELRLDLTGLRQFFGTAIFSALDIGSPKPLPDVFLAAADAFGVAPSRCAVVEDSVTGVRAARAAGMTVFGYCAIADPARLVDEGAIVFSDMSQLLCAAKISSRHAT